MRCGEINVLVILQKVSVIVGRSTVGQAIGPPFDGLASSLTDGERLACCTMLFGVVPFLYRTQLWHVIPGPTSHVVQSFDVIIHSMLCLVVSGRPISSRVLLSCYTASSRVIVCHTVTNQVILCETLSHQDVA